MLLATRIVYISGIWPGFMESIQQLMIYINYKNRGDNFNQICQKNQT
jgi:hypothetical protein